MRRLKSFGEGHGFVRMNGLIKTTAFIPAGTKKKSIVVVVSIVCLLVLIAINYVYFDKGRKHPLVGKISLSIDDGFSFLENHLWDEEIGAFREVPITCPLEHQRSSYHPNDNILTYIFYTEYEAFHNETKASMIQSFLEDRDHALEMSRWSVLSSNFDGYNVTEDDLYADNVALDGIYYFKTSNKLRAGYMFDLIKMEMLDVETWLIEDEATIDNGHEYYKLALASILASMLEEDTSILTSFVMMYSETLIDLQNKTDGSWLTDDLDPSSTCPNTETTILILIALDNARDVISRI